MAPTNTQIRCSLLLQNVTLVFFVSVCNFTKFLRWQRWYLHMIHVVGKLFGSSVACHWLHLAKKNVLKSFGNCWHCKWSTLKWPEVAVAVCSTIHYATPNPSQFPHTELSYDCVVPITISLTQHLNNRNCISSEAINSFAGTSFQVFFAGVDSMHYMY